MRVYNGTHGSDVLSNTCDLLEMSVGGVCHMCMCLARGGVSGVGGKWVRGRERLGGVMSV